MRAKSQFRLHRAIVVLLSIELFIAICEMALGLYYVIEGRGFAVSISQPMPKTMVVWALVLYVMLFGALFFCLLAFIKPAFANTRRSCLSVILIAEGVMTVYLLYMVVSHWIGAANDGYFRLSLLWNIPRILVSASLLLCAALYKISLRVQKR